MFRKLSKKNLILFFVLGLVLAAAFYFKGSFVVVSADSPQTSLLASETSFPSAGLPFVSLSSRVIADWQKNQGLSQNIGLGDKGPEVALLQEILPSLTPVYSKTEPATGLFGPLTKEAVENFQFDYNLNPTGYVGPETIAVISKIVAHSVCPRPDKIYPDLWLSAVDKNHSLPFEYYVPNNLVDVSGVLKTAAEPTCLTDPAATALESMISDAQKAGFQIEVDSGFRGIDSQSSAFIYWIETEGSEAVNESAFPGHSEHQLGTAVDLTGASLDWSPVDPRFGDSPEGRWLEANAYKYGFVMSYPQNAENITGYTYEPWHWRYVGGSIAAAIHDNNLVPEGYLEALGRK